jgi:hypothetical protein
MNYDVKEAGWEPKFQQTQCLRYINLQTWHVIKVNHLHTYALERTIKT